MEIRFLALLLLISSTQAISTPDVSHFTINSTSEDRGLRQSNGQARELRGKLYGSIKDTIRLNEKVEERKNEHKHGLSNTSRKAQGGQAGGAYGARGANANQRPRRSRNSAPSLLSGPHIWASALILFVNLAFIFLFPY